MPYHPPDIDRLISLYLSRRATESEKQELAEWLQAGAANREVFQHLKEIWCSDTRCGDTPSMSSHTGDHAALDKLRDALWAAGTKQQYSLQQPVGQRGDVYYWSKVAATYLIFLLGAWLFSYLVKERSTFLPEPVAWIESVNPAGQRSVHLLADGTKIWLNAGSKLTYPEQFSDTLRLLQLRGEAFFKVAKDGQRPFIVETAGIRTQALGTAFNIQAYPENDVIKIALLEGKVQVQAVDQDQTAILSPGEELLAAKDKTGFSRQPFHYEKTFGWKEGILLFDGADFESFRSAIEKWYGVKVEVKGVPPLDWHIRARYQQEDLRHVLRDICFNKGIRFKLNDKHVLIIF